MIRKKTLAALCLLGLLTPSCLGPFNAHNSLRNWNAELTDQDWINEVAFIGLHIIPVYGLAYLGDILIFNTVDYWSGDNPISEPGPFPASFGD